MPNTHYIRNKRGTSQQRKKKIKTKSGFSVNARNRSEIGIYHFASPANAKFDDEPVIVCVEEKKIRYSIEVKATTEKVQNANPCDLRARWWRRCRISISRWNILDERATTTYEQPYELVSAVVTFLGNFEYDKCRACRMGRTCGAQNRLQMLAD